MYQRSPRRYVTTVEGLDKSNFNLKKIAKYMRKKFSCGSTVVKDDKDNKIIKLQEGPKRKC
jgi:translation initiation factor 1 (eIF-1/SUI1)